jgi:hypothetical protein
VAFDLAFSDGLFEDCVGVEPAHGGDLPWIIASDELQLLYAQACKVPTRSK